MSRQLFEASVDCFGKKIKFLDKLIGSMCTKTIFILFFRKNIPSGANLEELPSHVDFEHIPPIARLKLFSFCKFSTTSSMEFNKMSIFNP